MKKLLERKTSILILGGITILVIIYLVASLGALELKPAKPFEYIQTQGIISPGGLSTWNGIGLVIIGLAFILIILFILLPPENRKKFLRTLGWLVFTGIIIFLILSKLNIGKQVAPPQESPGILHRTLAPDPTVIPAPLLTPAVFTPPQVSSWTSYLVALVFLLVILTVGGWLVWRRRNLVPPFEAIADIAHTAVNDLMSGLDWGDTILNSYYRMNRVVADWRGLKRQVNMTPSEFANVLVSTHLPRSAVYRLTALFERVRYGDIKPTPMDIQDAVDCLTAIMEYCEGAK